MLRRAKKLRAMKFKLDGPEFKFRALEFFTTTHLVKHKMRCNFFDINLCRRANEFLRHNNATIVYL